MKRVYEIGKRYIFHTYVKNDAERPALRESQKAYPVSTLIISFFIFSFVGWGWEVIIHLYLDHMFVNRGTMIGPWLPVYGCGGVLIIVLLRKWADRPGKLFSMILLLCGTIEYGTGLFLETVYHARWWDYSDSLINLQGRVCLEGLLLFGCGGLFIVYVAEPAIHRWVQRLSGNVRALLCISLLTIFAADFLYSMGNPNAGFGITM
ncbi:MAG TPA: hypothetical protein DCZ20_03725 [Lachnospiraceae bacterium]|nr:hypothetical protein [Lachnospiraceae bacterium]